MTYLRVFWVVLSQFLLKDLRFYCSRPVLAKRRLADHSQCLLRVILLIALIAYFRGRLSEGVIF